jgi:Flp pilus assembly pilin Flp
MRKIFSHWVRFGKYEEGVTSMEYALLAVLIAVVCVGAVTTVGVQTQSFYTRLSDAMTALGL